MRARAPESGFGPDEANLRTALRHTPVLPAPTTVEDLLVRLKNREIADASVDLADIILDARYPDVPERLSEVATPPSGSTSFFEPIHRTANSNIPLPAPRRSYRFVLVMLGLTLLSGLTALAWQLTRPIEGPSTLMAATALDPTEIEYSGIVSFEGPEVWIDSADKVVESPREPLRPVDPSNNVLEIVEPTLPPADVIAAQDAEDSQMVSPRNSPQTEVVASARDLEESNVEGSEGVPLAKASLRDLVGAVVESESDQTKPAGPYGLWAVSRNACSSKMQRRGHLVASISPRGARAGDTSCTFGKTIRRARTLQVSASCSDGKTTWKSNVRLLVRGEHLTWASEKGSTAYVRCPSG
jgi:hypothetical protein